ncbi:MAG: hypothetical protein ABH864_07255 [archaeon]
MAPDKSNFEQGILDGCISLRNTESGLAVVCHSGDEKFTEEPFKLRQEGTNHHFVASTDSISSEVIIRGQRRPSPIYWVPFGCNAKQGALYSIPISDRGAEMMKFLAQTGLSGDFDLMHCPEAEVYLIHDGLTRRYSSETLMYKVAVISTPEEIDEVQVIDKVHPSLRGFQKEQRLRGQLMRDLLLERSNPTANFETLPGTYFTSKLLSNLRNPNSKVLISKDEPERVK